jgi:hypothetical protein
MVVTPVREFISPVHFGSLPVLGPIVTHTLRRVARKEQLQVVSFRFRELRIQRV